MQKRDTTTAVPRCRGFINQAHTRRRKPGEMGVNVVYLDRDMVNARPTLGEKLGDGRFVGGWRHKLDATGVHRGFYLLGRHFLAIRLLAENKVPDSPRLGQVADRDSNMINAFHAADYEESRQPPEPTAVFRV